MIFCLPVNCAPQWTSTLSKTDVLIHERSGSPLGRLVRPDDVTEVIAVLAADGAAGITGEDINVSAGLVMY
ncbi:SDR family oxidoreductase [Kibdelosporangium aridum]|uniref:SDR family oxidoreductase n=1 Tax=Kibdelosporangium aridum TaxID=2030 RepID=UPI0035E5B701